MRSNGIMALYLQARFPKTGKAEYACLMQRIKLSETEQIEALKGVPGWRIEAEKLTKTFEFPSYARGVMFAAGVGHLADSMDHHPDILIGYQRVTIAVNTHDVGGISPWDFELARRIEGLTLP